MKKWLFVPLILSIILFFISSIAIAREEMDEERIVPEIKAVRVNPRPPQIDGLLNDPVWQDAKKAGVRDFTQSDPDEGKPATESTLVAVVYDDEAIYVAFWCYDSEPEKIARNLVRRDRWSQRDYVTFRVDPFHDHQTGNAFEVSAAGVQRDSRYYNQDWSDMSWDAVWESDVKIHDWGWSAEMKIPYHCLRFAEKDEHTWGVDFVRGINRKEEYVEWAFVPREEGGFVSNFGHLTGLKGIKPASHTEILPYVVARAETEPKSIGNLDGRDYLSNTGVDVKYALSSNIMLDAAINPDFGQVELDRPVLNLSVYETHFSEKRPFFLEGSDLFDTNFMLFYSRRVGKTLYSGVDDDEAVYYTDYPDVATILGSAKLSGKLANGTSIAFFTAVTEEEKADYAAQTNEEYDAEDNLISADTVMRTGVVEPLANYSILRVKQDVLKNSHVGGMVTLASKDGIHPAMTGGIDWRLSTNNSMWRFDGQAIFSRVDPDDVGYGFNASFSKSAGKHWRGSIGGTIKSPELDIWDMGYTRRNDVKHVSSWVQYRTDDDWWIIRNSWHNVNYYASWNFDGVNYANGGNYNTYIEFTNNWSFGGGVTIQGEKFSDDERRGNGLWEWPQVPTFSWWANIETDSRKKIWFDYNPGSGSDRGGTWTANYFGIGFRPKSNMEYSLGVNYRTDRNSLRYIGEYEDENDGNIEKSTFAELKRNQISIYGSANLLVNRNLSFQLSANGYIAGLDYENYRYYYGGQDYSDPIDNIDVDNNRVALNTTFLVRWEYLPGSTLYLVWTRARYERDENMNNFDFSRDFDRLFKGDSNNVFLIKASYWFNV